MTTPDLTRDLEPAALEAGAHAVLSLWRGKGLNDCSSNDMAEAAIRAYLSALSEPAAPAGAEVVKALAWRDLRGHAFPDMWCASSPCGVYDIEERNASDSATYVALGPNYSFIADKDSLEAAKAAAQADFEARIRSALATPQPVKPPINTTVSAETQAALDAIDDNIRSAAMRASTIFVGAARARCIMCHGSGEYRCSPCLSCSMPLVSQPVEPPDDSLNDIAAGNEAARDDEWGEAE